MGCILGSLSKVLIHPFFLSSLFSMAKKVWTSVMYLLVLLSSNLVEQNWSWQIPDNGLTIAYLMTARSIHTLIILLSILHWILNNCFDFFHYSWMQKTTNVHIEYLILFFQVHLPEENNNKHSKFVTSKSMNCSWVWKVL